MTINRIIFTLLLCGAGLVAAATTPAFVPGELVVKYKAGRTGTARAAVRARYGAHLRRTLPFSKLELWQMSDTNAAVLSVASRVAADSAVAYAEPNFIYTLERAPNDPYYLEGLLWGLNNTGQFGGTVDADIDAPEAWDFSTGGDVIVGVVDSGVDYTHPDLVSNMWRNPGEIPDDGIDNDHNGYVDDVFGIDPVSGDGAPMDDYGHGSHCAGTIAGFGNNARGVAGVCWQARIMALKFIAENGSGSSFDAIACIDYAIRMGARVLNNSWGGGPYSQALHDIIARANDSNVLFCAAAGNGGRDGTGDDNDLTPDYPSCYNNSNILAVAASDCNDALAVFSNYGSNSVDLAAPGVDIVSTVPGNHYAIYSGTSMATPHTCGAAALLLSFNPYLTVAEVKAALMNNVNPVPAFAPKLQTGGRLNVFNALRSIRGVFFDQRTYFTHSAVAVLLVDTNLAGSASVPVALWSDAGDREALVLPVHTPGSCLFTNTIRLEHGPAIPSNGVFEGVHGVQLRAAQPDLSITGWAQVSEALVISLATPPTTVPYATNAFALVGANNGNVLVSMSVSNAATGGAQGFSATNAWQAPPLPLSAGTDRNIFWVTGSNAYGFTAAAMVAITRTGPAGLTNHVAGATGAHQWPFATWAAAATSMSAAVSAAPDGNLILVNSGVYRESELIISRAVTVRGVAGAAQTILDAGYAHRCLSLTTNALVEGLTLLRGTNRYGGGVHMTAGVLRDCAIVSNIAGIEGGGAYLYAGATLERCSILGNACVGDAGGVYVDHQGTLSDCDVRGNKAALSGGGVVLQHGGLVSRCRVRANRAEENGGGIHQDSFASPTGIVTDTLLVGNVARKYGGALSATYGSDTRNCTIVSNRTELLAGGGVYANHGGVVRNCIVQYNSAGLGPNWYAANGNMTVGFTCTTPDPGGVSNTVSNPLFTQDGAWHLLGASPCVDTANAAWLLNPLDCAGAPRVYGAAPDMGAFEFAPAGLLCYFSAATNVAEPATAVAFAAQAWGTNLAQLVCAWDFDANGTPEVMRTNDLTATHAYRDPGVYAVRVTVDNAGGERATYYTAAAVTIVPEPLLGGALCLMLFLTRLRPRS